MLVFEDLHWADPTSLDLMRSLAERGAQAPLLIVATTRPEFRPPWAMRSHHGVVSLAPLDRAQVRRMVGEIASRHALSDEVIDGVGERTGGVPLFVEEVTRLLLERNVQGGAQAIPPTLQQSLAARLDRLGEAREVAQIGAVLGRDFSYRLLSDVSSTAAEFDELRLQAALDRLMEADLLFVDGAPPTATYRFKHALIQDAAYESLLKSRRQALHRRAADALRDANAEPEAIAHHFTEAGLDDLAIEWWGKAGDQALRRSAFQEAIAHLGKAIAMADKTARNEKLPPAARLRLQISLSNATMQAHGQHAPDVRATFLRARELAAAVDDPIERISAYYGLWVGSYMRGETEAMKETADAMMNEAGAFPGSSAACIAHRASGVTCWMAQGDFAAARTYLEQAVAFHDFERDRELAYRFGQDVGVAARDYLALVLWAVGEVDQARAMIDEAIALAISTEHAPSLAHAYWHQAILEFMRLDARSAKRAAKSCLTLARQRDLGLWLLIAPAVHGWAVATLDNAEAAGWDQLRRSLEACREQAQKLGATWFLPQLALAEARAGRHELALHTIESAIDDKVDLHFSDSESHRIRGTIFHIRDPASPELAEEAYLVAIAVARQQGARSFELRAALSLAKLCQSTDRPAEAHAVLAPALDGFVPTPEMPEIAEAQALLAVLGESNDVKAAEAEQQRRLHLQMAYGQAMMYSKGFAAEETKAAFSRAAEFAGPAEEASTRLVAYYAECLRGIVRGEYGQARGIAETFLQEAEAQGRATEAAAARRMLGLTLLNQGELKAARSVLERALEETVSRRDGETQFLFDWDTDGEASAAAYLALTEWHLGELERARQLIQQATRRADQLGHAATVANVLFFRTVLESRRDDALATQRAAEDLLE